MSYLNRNMIQFASEYPVKILHILSLLVQKMFDQVITI